MAVFENGSNAIQLDEKDGNGTALFFEDIYNDGNYFWFSEFDYNALFRIGRIDWKVEWMGTFPDEDFFQERLYSSVVMCGKCLFFAPYFAEEIAIYDIRTKEFRKIAVKLFHENKRLPQQYQKFCKVVAIEEKVYFIPDLYPGILCYDTNTEEISCFNDWIDEIEKNRINDWGYFITAEQVDNKLVLPCACAEAVVVFEITVQKTKVFRTSLRKQQEQSFGAIQKPAVKYPCVFCGICYVGGYYYLLSADGNVLKRRLDSEEEEVRKIALPIMGNGVAAYYPMCHSEEQLYLFPVGENRGYRIDIRTEEVIRDDAFDGENNFEGQDAFFLTCMVQDRKLYSVTRKSRCFMEYDIQGKHAHRFKLYPSEQDKKCLEEQKRIAFARQLCGSSTRENRQYSLKAMLDALQTWKGEETTERKTEIIQNGKEIYRAIAAR